MRSASAAANITMLTFHISDSCRAPSSCLDIISPARVNPVGGAESMSSAVYDDVEIEDMDFDAEKQTYYFPCPCGDKFFITLVRVSTLLGGELRVCATTVVKGWGAGTARPRSLPSLRCAELGTQECFFPNEWVLFLVGRAWGG
jgi:hypothetical protein